MCIFVCVCMYVCVHARALVCVVIGYIGYMPTNYRVTEECDDCADRLLTIILGVSRRN